MSYLVTMAGGGQGGGLLGRAARTLARFWRRGEQRVDRFAGMVGLGGQLERCGDGGQDRIANLEDAGDLHPVAAGAQACRFGLQTLANHGAGPSARGLRHDRVSGHGERVPAAGTVTGRRDSARLVVVSDALFVGQGSQRGAKGSPAVDRSSGRLGSTCASVPTKQTRRCRT
ncbi:hypothetical protein [Streptosporangium sandarakinum]|uniref:hypothetical protein n=1 Tax=Streptosporangium sandarakinum TaxID=1260955 RepID=UPI00344185BD